MSRDQNAGQNQNIRTDNKSADRVEKFKYLRTTLTDQNSIQEKNEQLNEFRECLLSYSAESFVFQFAIQKYKD